MTERQTRYLAALVAEREQTLVRMALDTSGTASAAAAKASFLLAWNRETEGGERRPTSRRLEVRQASEAIGWLLSDVQPDAPREAATGPAPEVRQGRYAIVAADGTVKFYKVDRPTEGRWAGYTFVKVQASDEWHRVPRPAQAAVLAAIAADPEGAMRRYGLELGRCGNCGRTLTDETSRAQGIGPDCAQRLGLDRSPYEAAARAERAARRDEIAREPRVTGEALADQAAMEQEMEGAVIVAEEQEAARSEAEARAAYEYATTPAATLTARVREPRLTWRERRDAVREQQDAPPAARPDGVPEPPQAGRSGRRREGRPVHPVDRRRAADVRRRHRRVPDRAGRLATRRVEPRDHHRRHE